VSHMFGTADLILSGQCVNFSCNYFGGTGFIYDKDLVVTSYAFLSTSTTGDCHVNCNSTFYVQIYGEGNVYYSGTPVLQYYNEGGSGKLLPE
jgi:hypothetical protein